jgi:hypothetical protein
MQRLAMLETPEDEADRVRRTVVATPARGLAQRLKRFDGELWVLCQNLGCNPIGRVSGLEGVPERFSPACMLLLLRRLMLIPYRGVQGGISGRIQHAPHSGAVGCRFRC